MSIPIQVGSTIIEFPGSGEPPNWSEPIIQFAEAVAEVVNEFAGPFDVPPQVINIDSANPGVPNTNIDPLSFPTTSVRAVFLRYSVFRSTNSGATTVHEAGNILACYDPNNPVGNKWEISHDAIGNAQFLFNVTDTGQFQYTATAISGTGHVGRLSISAQALLQN